MQAGPRSEEVGFAHDSALEGDGFEPSVPLAKEPASPAEGKCRRGQTGKSQKASFVSPGDQQFASLFLRRILDYVRRNAMPPTEIGGITAFHAAGAA
jgi:hypothetical protein